MSDAVRRARRSRHLGARGLAPLLLVAGLLAVSATAPAEDSPAGEAAPAEQPELAWLFGAPPRASWGEVEVPPAPRGLAELAPRGAELFAARCASCHGPEGRGDGPFAPDLPRPPRDLAGEALRTRDRAGPVAPSELFRALTVGAPSFGMPRFDHLPAADRWALVAHLLALAAAPGDAAAPLALPPEPAVTPALLARGATLFARSCATCHGEAGDGAGPAAPALVDARGQRCPPADLRRGPEAYRGGARPVDVARTIALGRPGTPMVPLPLEGDDLWAVAHHVARLAREGLAARRRAWDAFFAQRRRHAQSAPDRTYGTTDPRWDPEISARFETAPHGQRGCLACHDGIAAIATGAMAAAIDAHAGGDADRGCAVCHEGDPGAATKREAHHGLVPNPGSLWVTSIGLGCAKCHSDRGALTSLHGRPLPEATGGGLLTVTSRQTDPSGASGGNHAYRIQRALMGQETGKAFLVTASAGLVEGTPRYTNFPLDDPDGPVPCAGTPVYKEFMARAERQGFLLRLDGGGQGFPTYDEALALTRDPAKAGYLDYYRKDCARCHLWGEGKPLRGERRSSGCSACHVLNDVNGLSLGGDPTVPLDRPGHPLRHSLTRAIPEEQCNHCHTRGALTQHSEPHQRAGIGCVDCHTSIDIHGDGNVYGAIPHQLEIRCEDCHGTASARPWELPIGFGTPAAGEAPRGTWAQGQTQHLLTSRGNPRTNWTREGDQVVVRSELTGRRHVAPLLTAGGRAGTRAPASADLTDPGALERCTARQQGLPGHDRLACSACHNTQAPRCMPCHLTHFATEPAQDWLLSALDYDPLSTRQQNVLTPGVADPRPMGGPGMPWGEPELRRDRSGRLVPHIPGCEVIFTFVDSEGYVHEFVPEHNPLTPSYPPPVAPSLPHEFADPARSCSDCHPDGAERGKKVVLPGQPPR